MTSLRRRMIEDMQLDNLNSETQRGYPHHITGLARFCQTGSRRRATGQTFAVSQDASQTLPLATPLDTPGLASAPNLTAPTVMGRSHPNPPFTPHLRDHPLKACARPLCPTLWRDSLCPMMNGAKLFQCLWANRRSVPSVSG